MVQALMVMRRSRKQLLTLLIILISISIFYLYQYNDARVPSGIFERRMSERTFYVFHERVQVRLWIDLPTEFPWRHCLQLYAGHVETLDCGPERRGQLLTVEPLPGAGAGFQLRGTEEECVTVDGDHNLVYQSQPCSQQLDGYWRWSNLTGILIKSYMLRCK